MSPAPVVRSRNARGEGQRLRGEIIDAAARLLAEQPAEGLSLRAVAREVGVSAQSLYLHFADRHALMWAVQEHLFAELVGATHAAAATAQGADRLRAWCNAYCRFGLERPGHYRVLFESWVAEKVDVPLSQLPGHPLHADLLNTLTDALPTPKRGSEDLDELIALVWAQLHGLVSLRINKPSFPWAPMPELVDRFLLRLLP